MLLGLVDMDYIFFLALLNFGLVYFYQLKIHKRRISDKKDLVFLFVASLLNTWGMDTMHSLLDPENWTDSFKIALGVWLLFTAASSFKYYRFNSLPFKKFWLDYGGDLISYLFISAGVYAYT